MSSKVLQNEGTSNNANDSHDWVGKYETNEGSIEGVWIFHRHGDRTPSSPLCAEHMIENEAMFWRTKLPDPTKVEEVAARFPKKMHSSKPQSYLDGKREPYGFLTRVGVSQMYNAGRKFALRYNRLGRKNRSLASGSAEVNDLLNHWDISAYSTNYLRTITSAQFFLEGLLNSGQYPKTKSKSLKGSTESQTAKEALSIHEITPVNVRSREVDTLNAFDKNPEKMLSLVKEVVSSPEFQARDSMALTLATMLANFLPGLTSGKKKLFGGPSGINWIHACDHFVCRASHGLKLTAMHLHDEDEELISKNIKSMNSFFDPQTEESMQALAHPTMAHLAWRFRQWFTYAPLLGAIAVPPLRDVEQELRKTPHLNPDERRPMKIFSCHDVTILSLLYGLNAAEVLENERYWPPYATTLVFELVKVKEIDDYIVRVLLNGKPVKISRLDEKLMSIDDFTSIVDDLEIAGGVEEEDVDTESMERDMAGWTG